MYIKCEDGFSDSDFEFLRDMFGLLDARFDDLQLHIDESPDPDSMGLFDEGEYLSGMGFVACQRYLASTYGPPGVSKDIAMSLGPKHAGGEPVVRIINAAANYWKHVDEWDPAVVLMRDQQLLLDARQKNTIRIIETVTHWEDYTCFNLLAYLTLPTGPRFEGLVPILEAWRCELDSKIVG